MTRYVVYRADGNEFQLRHLSGPRDSTLVLKGTREELEEWLGRHPRLLRETRTRDILNELDESGSAKFTVP
jgi:hypothetical protein